MILIRSNNQSLSPSQFESLIETYYSSLTNEYKVSVCLKNPIHHFAAVYACLMKGKRVFSENFFQNEFQKSQCRSLFKPDIVLENQLISNKLKLTSLDIPPQALLAIATSGSTGNAKIVLIGPKALHASAKASCDFYQIKTEDLICSPLPLNHIGGILPFWRALYAKASLQVATDGIWSSALNHQAQHLSLVPAQLHKLMNDDLDWSSFKSVVIGGQAIDPLLYERAIQQSIPISLSYGSSESVAILSATKAGDLFDGSVGTPLGARQVKIDNHRLCFKGDACFFGYQESDGDSKPFDDEGYFHSLDMAHFKNDKLYIDGRADSIFKSGGENINPKEIEDFFLAKSSLERLKISPLKDDHFGNVCSALIYPRTKAVIEEVLSINSSLPAFKKIRFLSSSWPKLTKQELKFKANQLSDSINQSYHRWGLRRLNNPLRNRPDLVFLHGFMGDSSSLDNFASLFSAKFNIWTLDLPYHGRHQSFDYKNWEDVIDELACLFIRFSNLWLYGYSMGGRIALGLKQRYPKLVKKLILESTNPGLKSKLDIDQRIEFEKSIMAKMNSFDAFLKDWYQAKLFNLNEVEIKILIERTFKKPDSYTKALALFGLSAQPDLSDSIVSEDIISVCGEFDEKYRSLWPDCLVVKSCSHKASFQDPTQVSEIVLAHLAQKDWQ